MKRTMIELDAPAFWASNFLNNDRETYDADDIAEIDAWLDNEGVTLGECVGIKDDGDGDAHYYGHHYFLKQQGILGCDMYTYMFLLEGDAK